MSARAPLALLLWIALVVAPAARAAFTDVTAAAGLGGFVQHVENLPEDCVLGPFRCAERMTGGAAVADYDLDGDPDLFVTVLDGPDKLFQNQGNGTFVDVAAAAGLHAHVTQSNGAAFADLDDDGDPDLYVTTIGTGVAPNDRHYLWINDGQGGFDEEAQLRGVAIGSANFRLGFSAAVGDYDGDGFVDLFVAEWRPDGLSTGTPYHARLLRNRGAAEPGHFDDETAAATIFLSQIPAQPSGVWVFAPAFVDLDGDRRPDLALASDFGTSRLFWNAGDGTFSDGTAVANVGTDENGMGSTFGDVDADGDLDWFVTSIHDPAETCETASCNWGYTGNRLYRNLGGRVFADATDALGVREGHWGWGTALFDSDNDGDLDLVMTNGIDFDRPEDVPFNADPMRFWRNDGAGPWPEVSAAEGLTDTGSGKGLLVFDYDLDGDQDLFVVNTAAAPVLYRNDGGQASDWLRVAPEGVDVNRDALGTRVVVTPTSGGPSIVRTVGTASHFLGQGEKIAHFGLGAAGGPVHEVRVEWPNGRVSVLSGVARNQTLALSEPASDPCNDGFDNDGDGLVDFGADPGCDSALDFDERSSAVPCDDGFDDDGDGRIDYPADPGCDSPLDPSERTPTLACDNGQDDDLDLLVDYPADPVCRVPDQLFEGSRCQDGSDNDGDGRVDFDGGASHNGGVPLTAPDPHCEGHPWHDDERVPPACGLGVELALLISALAWARARRRA